MSQTDTLKPCPFCGADNIHKYGGGLSQDAEIVVCKNCHASAKPMIWNTRHIDSDYVMVPREPTEEMIYGWSAIYTLL